jgi:hypothetical protein
VKYPIYIEDMDLDGNIVRQIILLSKPSPIRIAIALPCYLIATLYLASLWNRTIEPWCAKFARKVEDVCMERKELLISSQQSNEKLETEEIQAGI